MVNYRLVLVIISITIYECQIISGFSDRQSVTGMFPSAHQALDSRDRRAVMSERWLMSACLAWCLIVLQSPRTCERERRERDERDGQGHCIAPQSANAIVVVRLTDVRVSQKPCLWLKFHRLTASWLSLLLRRSPWANRQPNREKARLPCLRTPWNRNITLHL